MHSKNNNIEFTFYNDGNEVGDKLFVSLRSRYQGNIEISMEKSDFFLIEFDWFIANLIEEILDAMVHILILQTG